jgi:phenylacetic acid degradation operon negative regulatory protein
MSSARAAALELPPTMSRRHAAGAESARGLLFTVLGEFVLPGGGSAWTSTFIEVFSRLGVEEKATRQALMRTAADGWLAAERAGRRTRWHLTGAAEQLLIEGTKRIYSFTGSAPDWDGRWVVLLARVPETDRPTRHALHTRMNSAGFGSPAPGVWISTHAEHVGEVELVLEQAGVSDAQIFLAEHQGGELVNMVAQAWDLAAIAESYQKFLSDFANPDRRDPLPRLIDLVHCWRRFPWIDPVLPREVLPEGWHGARAVKLFAKRHAKWSAAATAEWRRLDVHGRQEGS